MDPSKFKTMIKLLVFTTKKKVLAILSFTNYYYRCIVNYTTKACPPIDLTIDVFFTSE